MKDGCRLRRHRGGSDGEIGRDLHLQATGSKQKNPTECDSHRSWMTRDEVCARRA